MLRLKKMALNSVHLSLQYLLPHFTITSPYTTQVYNPALQHVRLPLWWPGSAVKMLLGFGEQM